MSIIGNALMAGVGDGMRGYAAMNMAEMTAKTQAASRREELAMKLKADRDDLLTRLEAMSKEGEANRQNQLAIEQLRRESGFERRPDLYGAEGPIDRGDYETTDTTYSRVDDSEYSDAVSRKMAPLQETTAKKFDEAGYKKADDERVRRNINRKTQVDKPEHYDDQQRGAGRELVNDMLRKDPKSTEAAAAAAAVEGKNRYAVSGNTVIDNATGETKATDVGASIIDKNKRPPAGKGGGGGPKTDTERGKNARANAAIAERELRDAQKNLAKLQEKPWLNKETIPKQEAAVRTLEQRLRQAQAELITTQKPGDNPAPAAAAGGKNFRKLWN